MSPLATLDRLPSRTAASGELSEPPYTPRHRPSRKRLSRPPQCRGALVPNADDHSACQGHVHRSSRSGFRVALHRLAARPSLLGGTALAAMLVALPETPPMVLALAGLWLVLGAPVTLWYSISAAFVTPRDGRALVSAGLAVLTEIVMALAVNTTLPAIGLRHPLSRFPLVAGALLVVAVLAAVAPVGEVRLSRRIPIPVGLRPVLLTGTAAITLAVAGAIRLNNGLSGAVSVVALLVVAALLALVFLRRERNSSTVTGIGLFLAAAAVLLLNSLRGWFITGHDIQVEYQVFQLADSLDRWDIGAFREPYNACLSINLWPVLLSRVTGIPGDYVFKAVFPLLFALTPVLVYRSVRNVASQAIALLSAIYFMAFPTFFTDMTFMGRQEIAFLLLGGLMVVVTDAGRPLKIRRPVVLVLLLGIVLSHYSTTYLVLATFGIALGIDYGGRLWRQARRQPPAAATGFVTWWMVVLVAAGAVAWTGPATGTGGQVRITVAATVSNLLGKTSATGSSDTGYSLFGGEKVSTGQRLRDYIAYTEQRTSADRAAGGYLPLPAIDSHPISVVGEDALPLTAFGSMLDRIGVDVPQFNGLVRRAAAGLLQMLLLIGLIAATFARRRTFRAPSDQTRLSIGALGVLGVLTVLPQLSVDYGVLRAFQQGLIFFAPFVAAASVWIFRWTTRELSARIAFGLVLGLFLDLTGVVPTLLGGYPAQLQLANTGQYYDLYYVHPEDRSAVRWLDARGVGAADDIFPTLIATRDYVRLDYATVHKGEATAFYRGDAVTYRYPFGVLDATKNKIYSSDGAAIYR